MFCVLHLPSYPSMSQWRRHSSLSVRRTQTSAMRNNNRIHSRELCKFAREEMEREPVVYNIDLLDVLIHLCAISCMRIA